MNLILKQTLFKNQIKINKKMLLETKKKKLKYFNKREFQVYIDFNLKRMILNF